MAVKKKPYKDYSDDSPFHKLIRFVRGSWEWTGSDWCLLPTVAILILIATGIAALAAKLF